MAEMSFGFEAVREAARLTVSVASDVQLRLRARSRLRVAEFIHDMQRREWPMVPYYNFNAHHDTRAEFLGSGWLARLYTEDQTGEGQIIIPDVSEPEASRAYYCSRLLISTGRGGIKEGMLYVAAGRNVSSYAAGSEVPYPLSTDHLVKEFQDTLAVIASKTLVGLATPDMSPRR